MRRLLLLATLGVVGCLLIPGSSVAAVTVGVSDLSSPSSGGAAALGGDTFVNTALPAGNQQVSPIDGIVVRYRVQATGWGNLALRILRPAGGGAFDAVGTSAATFSPPLVDDLVHGFDTRLPIASGDRIGVDADDSARFRDVAGAAYGLWLPRLDDSAPPSAPTPVQDKEILFNADVEADADHDGFGDETQDACPSSAATQGPCPAAPQVVPQAKKKKCKRHKKRHPASAAKKKSCKKKRGK